MTSSMDRIKESGLPGFYVDERGVYGIIIGNVYICCFINDEDGEYDVTVDTVDENGDFAHNLSWEGFVDPKEAVKCLRENVKKYAK